MGADVAVGKIVIGKLKQRQQSSRLCTLTRPIIHLKGSFVQYEFAQDAVRFWGDLDRGIGMTLLRQHFFDTLRYRGGGIPMPRFSAILLQPGLSPCALAIGTWAANPL